MSRSIDQANHKLLSTAECREAIVAAVVDAPVTLKRSDKALTFHDASDRLLGTLTLRHSVAKRLEAGENLLHCSVAWSYGVSNAHPNGLVSVRVATGDPSDPYVQWYAREVWGKPREPREPRRPKAYALNIVGESFYQREIGTCSVGDPVTLFRQPTNPHDPRAIVVLSKSGSTIGHVPASSWIHRVVHDDGAGIRAQILALHAGANTAVVLEVTVCDEPLDEAPYVSR